MAKALLGNIDVDACEIDVQAGDVLQEDTAGGTTIPQITRLTMLGRITVKLDISSPTTNFFVDKDIHVNPIYMKALGGLDPGQIGTRGWFFTTKGKLDSSNIYPMAPTFQNYPHLQDIGAQDREWLADGNSGKESAVIRFGGPENVTVWMSLYMLADLFDSVRDIFWPNQQKWDRDFRIAPVYTLTLGSFYSQLKNLALELNVRDDSTGEVVETKDIIQLAEVKADFWSHVPGVDQNITLNSFDVIWSGSAQTSLSSSKDNTVEFKVNLPAGTIDHVYIVALKTNGIQNNAPFHNEVIKGYTPQIVTDAGTDQLDGVLYEPTVKSADGGGDYTLSVTIPAGVLVNGDRYRFACIMYTDDTEAKQQSILSDEYVVAGLPAAIYPDIEGEAYDVEEGGAATGIEDVVVHERLLFVLKMDKASYDTRFNTQFGTALSGMLRNNLFRVEADFYDETDGETLLQGSSYFIVGTTEAPVAIVEDANYVYAKALFRVPYDAAGHTCKVKWRVYLNMDSSDTGHYVDYVDRVETEQIVDPLAVAADFTSVDLEDEAGNPITTLCGEETVVVKVTKVADANTYYPVVILMPFPYDGQIGYEEETFAGNELPLFSTAILSEVPPTVTGAATTFQFKVKVAELPKYVKLRMIVILKQA